MNQNYHRQTKLIHAPLVSKKKQGPCISGPILSTAFEHETAETLEDIFTQKTFGYIYTRISNPTIATLEQRLSSLDQGIGCVVTSSGMSAVSCCLLTILKAGDEFVCGNSLFGGCYSLFTEVFPRFGITPVFVEASDTDAYARAINKKTKLVFLEVIGNPKMDVPDLRAISDIAHHHNIPVVLDNTVATPSLFLAKNFGADILIYSTSKYINGHGNAIGGAIIDCGTFSFSNPLFSDFQDFVKKFKEFAFLAKLRQQIFSNMGACLSPHSAFLQIMGLDTLDLRMIQHSENALKLALFLEKHPQVKKVNYIGLSSSPWYETAVSQFSSRFGGLLTIELLNKKQAFQLINHRDFISHVANIGDTKTLIIHPESTIYKMNDKKTNAFLGVTSSLLRISVGLENISDIIEDFDKALQAIT